MIIRMTVSGPSRLIGVLVQAPTSTVEHDDAQEAGHPSDLLQTISLSLPIRPMLAFDIIKNMACSFLSCSFLRNKINLNMW